MYTALVHTWYEDAAVNTAGFYWEEGHRYYMVVESDVPGWQESDAKYVREKLSTVHALLECVARDRVELKVIHVGKEPPYIV